MAAFSRYRKMKPTNAGSARNKHINYGNKTAFSTLLLWHKAYFAAAANTGRYPVFHQLSSKHCVISYKAIWTVRFARKVQIQLWEWACDTWQPLHQNRVFHFQINSEPFSNWRDVTRPCSDLTSECLNSESNLCSEPPAIVPRFVFVCALIVLIGFTCGRLQYVCECSHKHIAGLS